MFRENDLQEDDVLDDFHECGDEEEEAVDGGVATEDGEGDVPMGDPLNQVGCQDTGDDKV